MRWHTFLVFNIIGAALWVGFWSAVGYFGGSHIDTFLRYQLYFTVAATVFILLFVAHKVIERKKASKHNLL